MSDCDLYNLPRAYLGGWGSGGSTPPPPPTHTNFRFFSKSEGKRQKENKLKRDVGGVVRNFWGLRHFQGVRNFRGGGVGC